MRGDDESGGPEDQMRKQQLRMAMGGAVARVRNCWEGEKLEEEVVSSVIVATTTKPTGTNGATSGKSGLSSDNLFD
jgi:hypothetical protein